MCQIHFYRDSKGNQPVKDYILQLQAQMGKGKFRFVASFPKENTKNTPKGNRQSQKRSRRLEKKKQPEPVTLPDGKEIYHGNRIYLPHRR